MAVCNEIKTRLTQKQIRHRAINELTEAITATVTAPSEYHPDNVLQQATIEEHTDPELDLYIAGYNYTEIAEIRGCAKSTSRDRINKNLRKLSKLLNIELPKGVKNHRRNYRIKHRPAL